MLKTMKVEKLIKRVDKVRPPTEVQYSTSVKKKDPTKNTKLCYLGKNESVGDLEVLLDIDTYMQTAVCTEKTEVLVLEMKHYERLFVKRHPRTIEAMRELLKVKLDTRRSLLTKQDDIPFLRLLQNRILAINAPKLPDMKRKVPHSVSAAEREFLNHKGPLIDAYGPGSVWYVIRERDKMKKKLNAHQEKMKIRQPPSKNTGHMHTIRLPQTLLMAAQMAGATQEIDVLMEKAESLKPIASSSPRPTSARSSDIRVPRSFRKILSAHRAASEERRPEIEAGNSDCETELARSLPDTRQTAISFLEEREDATLSYLEEKVRKWLSADNPKGGANVVQLRRLPVQEMDEPKPGNKIVLRRRKTPSTNHHNRERNHSVNKGRNSPDKHGHYKILVHNKRHPRPLKIDSLY
ncbi:hypothetical protein KUTeg_022321 [Tegillarca granosa]|uniref:Cyclic nucleotide-binding domain-containing protein n=1 Tax=Tegillarca granosa TaxID=220873 RepID=A0ABQ9E689_TEGGR|nr:hypothetical protein KUTeg_022321 [Tegillarca granosa]